MWHPDVLEFIKSKSGALKDTQLQNFNISVGMYDYFFEAITSNEKIPLVNPRKTSIDGSHDSRRYAMVKARHYMKEDWVQEFIIDELEANGGSIPLDKTLLVTIDEALAIAEREGAIMSLEDPVEVFNDIVKSAWESGDPGLIFIDTINRRHPVWYLGKISATNPCVSRDARILTPKGWVKAGDIYEEARRRASPTLVVTSPKLGVGGEPIAYQAELLVPIADVPIGINGHELWFKIAKPVKSYVWHVGRKRALKVITKEGYTVVVTEDHRFLTPNGWKRAKDLKRGDRIALLRLHPASLLSINGEVVDPDIAFAIGWLIGDGVMNEYYVSWHFNPANDKAISRVEVAIAKLGGGEEVHKTNEGSRVTIRCNSTSLVYRRLREYIGKDARELNGRIPDSVWRWCPEGYVEFLRALFTARGFVDHGGSIVLTALSRELLEDVLVMLSTFGIAGEIGKRDLNEVGSSGPSYLLFSQHELVIRESISRKLFMDYIGFEVGNGVKDDAKRGEDIGPMYYAEVKGVEDVGLKDFYDFTVPGFHNYIAQAIINHNCGEEPLLEWESCNLGSINLEKYVRRSKEGEPYIDWEGLAKDVAVAVRFLDNVITVSRYPLKQLEAAARRARKIGLGVMGWAHMLVKLGIPYDSIDALYLGYYLAEWIAYNAYLASVELSRERGPFPAWDEKLYRPYWITAKPLKELLRIAGVKGEVSEKVRRLIEKRPLVDWSKVREGMLRHGLRNAALLSVAPTGTISIIAGTSSSIEPIFALAFTRVVSVGVFIEVNSLFLEALASYGLDDPEVIKAIAETGTIAHNPFMPRPLRKVFRVAHDIEPIWHVLHQAVWQQWVDAGVSKTVNMRAEATPDHVRDVYVIAWALGCKGITVYRDRSKSQQVIHFGIKLSKKMAKRGEVLGVETIRPSKVGSDYSGKSTGEPSLIGTETPLNVGVKTKERGEAIKGKGGSRFRLSSIVLEDGDVGDCKSCEY
ncbi:MAG: hypothetical protein DRO09_00690 [Thermoprotei archaeon]|nr:MAG: hypothetical protein DRO09_00690 [Thermoprotei archaeon]